MRAVVRRYRLRALAYVVVVALVGTATRRHADHLEPAAEAPRSDGERGFRSERHVVAATRRAYPEACVPTRHPSSMLRGPEVGSVRRLFGTGDGVATPDHWSGPAGRVPPLPDLEDRETEIPEDGYRLDGGPGVDAVGESFYRETVARATGGLRRDGVHMQLTAELVREPDNPQDPDAIAVRIGAETIAYAPRETAPAFGPVFERLASLGYRAYYCSAVIRGGWDRGDGTIADFRVVLHLSSPRRQMIVLDRETVRRAAEADPRAGYANTTCPYCAIALDPLPKAKKKCPGCGQSILVRSGPDRYRYLVQEQDLHVLEEAWAEAAAADAADDFYR